MKNKTQILYKKRHNVDLDTLRRWKHSSTEATLNWLQDALAFSKNDQSNQQLQKHSHTKI